MSEVAVSIAMNNRKVVMTNRKPRRAARYVYHYTSTEALPWILMSGELRPSWCGGDDNHFIWATADPTVETTAAPLREPFDDDDLLRTPRLLVRLALPGKAFIPWDKIKTMPPWTAQQAAEWDEAHGGKTDKWQLRREPLPLASVRRIDVGGPGRWSRIRVTRDDCYTVSDDPPIAAVRINGFDFLSIARFAFYERKTFAYYEVPDPTELQEIWEEQQ